MTTQEAVIEIGSTGIRLSIADVQDSENWTFIDHAELPIALGWDVFTTGLVSRETLLQCLQILSRFKEQIATYEISAGHITVIATSALREAAPPSTSTRARCGFLVGTTGASSPMAWWCPFSL